MEYDFNIMRRPGVLHEATDAMFKLTAEGTGDLGITDEISVMVIATPTQKRLSEAMTYLLTQSQIRTNEPQLAESHILPLFIIRYWHLKVAQCKR